MIKKLADHAHPEIRAKAEMLIEEALSDEEKLKRIVDFVRDGILFGFPAKGDFVFASETLRTGIGQCNTKGTLLLALLRAAGLNARMHFSLISKEIQKGFFTGLFYWILPAKISHSWIEVQVGTEWRAIDNFINDTALHDAAVEELARRGWPTGFSVALEENSSDVGSPSRHYEQMGAVTDDHGVWQDPADYYNSSLYQNRPVSTDNWLYQRVICEANRRVRRLRLLHESRQRKGE